MRVLISGASGRMGTMLVRAVALAEAVELAGATERLG
ncbi:MAG: 4-hydroxy-tetrahydrodipicolinate reductase, partial [Ghiorsea sp.]|nr:4-hydroxy-tetrahydrodipicolinate reductase [Ghiorsea sp.]